MGTHLLRNSNSYAEIADMIEINESRLLKCKDPIQEKAINKKLDAYRIVLVEKYGELTHEEKQKLEKRKKYLIN